MTATDGADAANGSDGANGSDRHRYDAGDLGCATGLPKEFRRRLGDVTAGEQLEVVTSDPAAREDLPSLARLLGHSVTSVETAPDGRFVITVEVAR